MLSDDGYDTISNIIHWKYNNIREWCPNRSNFSTTRGGDPYGDTEIKCIQALEWWATDLTFRGEYINLSDFDATMMVDCIYEAKLDYENGKKYPRINKPDKFSHRK